MWSGVSATIGPSPWPCLCRDRAWTALARIGSVAPPRPAPEVRARSTEPAASAWSRARPGEEDALDLDGIYEAIQKPHGGGPVIAIVDVGE